MKTGYKSSEPTAVKGYDGPERMPETFSIDVDSLKEARDWKVGEKYNVEMKVKMVGIREDSYDKATRVTFEIVNVSPEETDDGN